MKSSQSQDELFKWHLGTDQKSVPIFDHFSLLAEHIRFLETR
jgi:hypothetical protein